MYMYLCVFIRDENSQHEKKKTLKVLKKKLVGYKT